MSRRGIAVFAIGLGLLLGALAARNGTLALLSLPFIAYLAVGLLESPPADLRLAAERAVDSTRTGDSTAVRVVVRVHGEGASTATLRLSDSIPKGVVVSSGSPVKHGSLRPGESIRLSYAFHASRGAFHWEAVHATAADPFFLFERTFEIPAAAEAVVLPRIRRFRPFLPSPERTLRSPGAIPSGRAGSGTDFWGVRPYVPGDEMRRLDWRRVARHGGRLFIRENEQEEIADIGLVLDARAEADLQSGGRRLVPLAIDAAASLSEMFLRSGNRVGMVLLGSELDVVRPGYGKVQLHRILRALSEIHGDPEPSPLSLSRVPLRCFSTRALILVLSPLTCHEWELFPRLRARGNEGLLISPDPVDFMKDEARDALGRLAYRVACIERRLELRRVAELGIRVVDWKVDCRLAPLVHGAMRPSRGSAGGAGR